MQVVVDSFGALKALQMCGRSSAEVPRHQPTAWAQRGNPDRMANARPGAIAVVCADGKKRVSKSKNAGIAGVFALPRI
jgi:hypothetical protein